MPRLNLTARQRLFVAEYIVDKNATQGAIRAGYSPKTARFIGAENLKKPNIAQAIGDALNEQMKRVEVSADSVVRELAKIAFANVQDFICIDPGGDLTVHLVSATRDQLAGLQEITIEEISDGRGKNANKAQRVRIKLADKLAALVALGKHFGIFDAEKPGKPGEDLSHLSDAELSQRRERLIKRRNAVEHARQRLQAHKSPVKLVG